MINLKLTLQKRGLGRKMFSNCFTKVNIYTLLKIQSRKFVLKFRFFFVNLMSIKEIRTCVVTLWNSSLSKYYKGREDATHYNSCLWCGKTLDTHQ